MNPVTCLVCNDTHAVPHLGSDRLVPCTSCPVPCESCRGRFSAFCLKTPCDCSCHQAVPQLDRKSGRWVDDVPVEALRRILKRAGVAPDFDLIRDDAATPSEKALLVVARALLVDAVREDARWTERVKLLERRIDFAVDVMRGSHDDARSGA